MGMKDLYAEGWGWERLLKTIEPSSYEQAEAGRMFMRTAKELPLGGGRPDVFPIHLSTVGVFAPVGRNGQRLDGRWVRLVPTDELFELIVNDLSGFPMNLHLQLNHWMETDERPSSCMLHLQFQKLSGGPWLDVMPVSEMPEAMQKVCGLDTIEWGSLRLPYDHLQR